MTTPTTHRATLFFGMLAAYLAARDTAHAAGFRTKVDENGIDTWVGVGEPPQPVTPFAPEDAARAAEHFQVVSTTFGAALDDVLNDAELLRALRDLTPTDYTDALIRWHMVQAEYEDALTQGARASAAYARLEDAMGRVRRECGRKIQEAHLATSDKPIADTPLDKHAGDHPDYVAHRDAMAKAKETREHWEARVKALAGRVDIARVVAEGFVRGAPMPQREALRPRGTTRPAFDRSETGAHDDTHLVGLAR